MRCSGARSVFSGSFRSGLRTSPRPVSCELPHLHQATAELATKAKPKLLVLYHQLYFGPRDEVDLEKEIRRTYTGAVVNGRDLTVY